MANRNGMHLTFELASEKYRKDPSAENGDRVVRELTNIILRHEDIIFEGVDTPTGTQPGGFQAPDGKFYFHIFTGSLHFTEELTGRKLIARAQTLWDIVVQNPSVGGFSINHGDAQGAILVMQEEIEAMMK